MTLIDRVLEYVKRTYRPTRPIRDLIPFFARGAALVSQGFTSDRPDLPKNYFNRPEYRSGYLLYFVAANAPKVTHALRLIRPTTRFAGMASVRMLDLGCGPGTAALAAAEMWQSLWQHPDTAPRIEIFGIDQNRKILHDAEGLFTSGHYTHATLRTAAHDVTPASVPKFLAGERFDLIVCANLLNEMGPIPNRERLMNNLLAHHLTERGVLIIIEPALRQTTRDLMELRDRLVPTARILAPCLHHDRCPMLALSNRDWCHAYLDWHRPELITKLDALIGNKKDYLKFSYLILESNKQPTSAQKEAALPQPLYRVVSAPLRSNGKIELLLCPATGNATSQLVRLTRLDKDTSALNRDMDHVLRGDLATTTSRTRIGKTDPFTIVRAFQS